MNKTSPVARSRTRSCPGPLVDAPCAPVGSVTALLSPAACCVFGEVRSKEPPQSWRGWPNGSLVVGTGGKTHKGRFLRTAEGAYHVLRWQPFARAYVYVTFAKTDEAAMLAL